MGRKESYSDRLRREGGMAASGKFREIGHGVERDYLERTIATVRNHASSDNSWPQWANIFADEIERLWIVEQQLATANREVDAQMQAKLDAQSLLANICEAIGIDRSEFDLNDTWKSVAPAIIDRLTAIVDAEAAAVARADTLTQALREIKAMPKRHSRSRGYMFDTDPQEIARDALSAAPNTETQT